VFLCRLKLYEDNVNRKYDKGNSLQILDYAISFMVGPKKTAIHKGFLYNKKKLQVVGMKSVDTQLINLRILNAITNALDLLKRDQFVLK